MKLNTYTIKGVKKSAGVVLPKKYEADKNLKLLAQAIRVYENRLHPGLSKTKTRGEISLTTKKWYRQKGTGGARHGAKSAPIFVGGSKAHGPKGVKRVLTLSKNMKQKSLAVAVSMKAKEDKLFVIDGFSSLVKTKDAASLIAKLIKSEKSVTEKSKYTIAFSQKNKDAALAVRNLKNTQIIAFKDLNAYKVYLGGVLIVDNDAFGEDVKDKKAEVKEVKKEPAKKRKETKKKAK